MDWDLAPEKAQTPLKPVNYYEILELPTSATRLQVREAYIRLKSMYSANSQVLYSLISEDDARRSIESIDEAYRVLDDELLRRRYDASIGIDSAASFTSEERADAFSSFDSTGSADKRAVEIARSIKAEEQERLDANLVEDSLWQSKEPLKRRSFATSASESARLRRFSAKAFDEENKERARELIENSQVFDGGFFRRLREVYSASQEEIQDKTKISLQYIKAIESDDYRCLPSLVYIKGFLRCYLQYLGLEKYAEQIIQVYTEAFRNWRSDQGATTN